MKKFLSTLFIFFFAFAFQQANSQTLYKSNVESGYYHNPGVRAGTPSIVFDDVNIPNELISETDSMILLNVKVVIARRKRSPATVVKFYATSYDPATVGIDSFPAIPPVLLGSVNIRPNSGEADKVTIELGDSKQSRFTFKADRNNVYPGYTTIFIGLSFSETTNVGWETADGPGYNVDLIWTYRPDDATKPRYASYFGTQPKASFNLEVFGRTKNKPTPVILTNFDVQTVNNYNVLAWSSSQENNSDYYGVEHSTDGNNFESIDQVAAAGNSSNVSNYTYTDASPAAGLNYYRLKMADRDNSITYSAIRSVKNAAGNMSFRAYPNPALEILYVDIPSDKSERAMLSVTNVAGQTVLKDEINVNIGNNKIPVKVANLSTGTYIIKVQLANQSFIQKFNKQ